MRMLRSILLILTLPLMAGCLSLEQGYPDKRFYAFETARTGAPRSGRSEQHLRVRSLRVSPRFEQAEFVMREAPSRYASDFYNVFFAPPASLITEELYSWLSQSELFGSIAGDSSFVEATHVLEGAVTDLYGDLGDEPAAVLGLQIFVIALEDERARLVLKLDLKERVAIGADDPEALIKGWNEALRRLLERCEQELAEAMLDS
jgi:cholesterol transport system auxiliary component